MYIIAYSFLKNEADAVEMVSQTIFIVLKKYKQLRNQQYFKTWVTRILINQCKKELKRQKKYEMKEEVVVTVEAFNGLPLKEALATLPDNLRIIVELRYFHEYSLKEISYLLDKPISTISSQLKRALTLLKIELYEEDNDE